MAAVIPNAAARTTMAIAIHGGGLERFASMGAGSDVAAKSPAVDAVVLTDAGGADKRAAVGGGAANGSAATEMRSAGNGERSIASSSFSAVARRDVIGTTLLRAVAGAPPAAGGRFA